ncbi:hypothetical protein ACA910_018099 [Epithemia clementina (nom. ined.)]
MSSGSSARRNNVSASSLIAAAALTPTVCGKPSFQFYTTSTAVEIGSTLIPCSTRATTNYGRYCKSDTQWGRRILLGSTEVTTNSNSLVGESVSYLLIPRGGASKDDKDRTDKQGKSGKHRKSSRKARGKSHSDDTEHNTDNDDDDNVSSNHSKRKGRGNSMETGKKEAHNEPSPMVEEILKEDDYYKVLGLNKQDIAQSTRDAGDKIKKAYRRRALLTHPDKTDGDRRAFDKVAEAYDVLSDDNKRKLYDRLGKKGLEQYNGGGGGSGFHSAAGFASPEDLFRSFFGGGMASSGRGPSNNPFMRRNRTLRYQLEVTLEDLYKGANRDILVAPPGIGPRQDHYSKRVNVQIPRGALAGQTVVLSGEMDFDSNDTPGDLIFELRQRKHALFTRKNHDLAISVDIRLTEALTGVQRRIRFLDGTELVLQSARRRRRQGSSETGAGGSGGESNKNDDDTEPILIKDGDVHVMKGYGMPKDLHGHEFGDLYVQYHVVVPQIRSSSTTSSSAGSLSMEEREQLGHLLDKLEGVSRPPLLSSTTIKTDGNESGGVKGATTLQLKKGVASDFGFASGQPDLSSSAFSSDETSPPGVHEEFDDSPFSGARSQFFFSSGASSHPFFGMRRDEEDMDGNMQCQQM